MSRMKVKALFLSILFKTAIFGYFGYIASAESIHFCDQKSVDQIEYNGINYRIEVTNSYAYFNVKGEQITEFKAMDKNDSNTKDTEFESEFKELLTSEYMTNNSQKIEDILISNFKEANHLFNCFIKQYKVNQIIAKLSEISKNGICDVECNETIANIINDLNLIPVHNKSISLNITTKSIDDLNELINSTSNAYLEISINVTINYLIELQHIYNAKFTININKMLKHFNPLLTDRTIAEYSQFMQIIRKSGPEIVAYWPEKHYYVGLDNGKDNNCCVSIGTKFGAIHTNHKWFMHNIPDSTKLIIKTAFYWKNSGTIYIVIEKSGEKEGYVYEFSPEDLRAPFVDTGIKIQDLFGCKVKTSWALIISLSVIIVLVAVILLLYYYRVFDFRSLGFTNWCFCVRPEP